MGPRPRTQALGGRPGVDPTQTLGYLGEVHRAQDAQRNRAKNDYTGAFASENKGGAERMAEGITRDETDI